LKSSQGSNGKCKAHGGGRSCDETTSSTLSRSTSSKGFKGGGGAHNSGEPSHGNTPAFVAI